MILIGITRATLAPGTLIIALKKNQWKKVLPKGVAMMALTEVYIAISLIKPI